MVREFLRGELQLEDKDLYMIPGPLDCKVFFSFTGIEGYDHLRYPAASPQPSYELEELGAPDMWTAIAKQDIMVHHPYETFDTVENFIKLAATDPDVLAIKQTLYRVSSRSPIIAALAEAAENGKQVTVLMEVKARFDEEKQHLHGPQAGKGRLPRYLRHHGIKDPFENHPGSPPRRRRHPPLRPFGDGQLQRQDGPHLHGRRHPDGQYAFIGVDASAFFNLLSGYSDPPQWNKLAVAPLNLRERIYEKIEQETAWAKKGKKAFIVAKMNSLLDKEVIAKLYEASAAGVKIHLIVRGICVLRPGLPGISENIEVHSVVGRFLEHSRLFYFYNNGEEDVFISSADWMPRNLNERVELMIPVEYGPHKERIKGILSLYFNDNVKAYAMNSDGTYRYIADERPTDAAPIHAQMMLQHEAEEKHKKHKKSKRR